MNDRRKATSAEYEARIAFLEAEVQRSWIDLSYGCLSQFGLLEAIKRVDASAMIAVYFDLDRFRNVNDRFGKFVANNIVAQCIKPRGYDVVGVMKQPIALIGRWFSGDELAGLFAPQDAFGYVERVRRAFWRFEITATFVIAPAHYKGNPIATLNFCENTIKAVKATDQRNLIVSIGV